MIIDGRIRYARNNTAKKSIAKLARNFGFLLLDKGSSLINLKSFHYYDRMYPSQEVAGGIGNLIALPL